MTGGTHAAAKPSSSSDEAVRRRTASLDPLFNPASVVILGEADTPESRTGRLVATIAKSVALVAE
jgi:hypothetical protein